jgi:23S rRNA (uracil1939-C5)-methyltransferase
MTNQEHIISIESLVAGGKGLGRLPDGKAIFIPFVLPGERVRVRLREEKKGYAIGELLEVLEENPIRIKPKCLHYQQCGGCHLQHIAYADQVQFKREFFIEQLQRIGGLEQLPPIDVIEADPQWHYRNAVQFHTTAEGELAYMDAAHARPFPVKECWLPMDQISSLWPQISLDDQMDLKRLEVRQNQTGEILLIIESRGTEIPEMEITLPLSAVHVSAADEVVLSGDPYLLQTVGSHAFQVSARSFFQTNFQGARALVNTVMEMASPLNGTLLDLYCGVGLFSRFLAEQFNRIFAVEVSESACDDFLINLGEFEHISLYQGTVERVLPDLDVKADCVIVDPPRKGVDRYALDAITDMRVPAIIYVSCDPATLARDIKRMNTAGYVINRSVLVDMFPQTYHTEAVVLMSRVD